MYSFWGFTIHDSVSLFKQSLIIDDSKNLLFLLLEIIKKIQYGSSVFHFILYSIKELCYHFLQGDPLDIFLYKTIPKLYYG